MNSKLKMLGGAAACVAAGFLIGRLFPISQGNRIPTEGNASIESAGNPNMRAKGDGRQAPDWPAPRVSGKTEWKKDSRPPEHDQEMVWIPSALLDELSASGGTRLPGQGIFGEDNRIDELLGISDHEKAVIQTAWKDTQQKLRALEASTMKSEVSDDGSVVTITVPDLSSRSAEVGEGFGAEIRKALGENRSDVFLAVKQVDLMFSPEPGERTYRIEPEETGDGGWRYHMTLEGPGSRRVWVSETIPEEISHLTDVASIRRSLSED